MENTDQKEILVYGIPDIETIRTRECVTGYEDDGESVLLTFEIKGKTFKVRVLKEHPVIGTLLDEEEKQ